MTASPARRRGRRPAGQDTRALIVDSARAEFAARGYDATTMRGIARSAGVDPRLVHHYFESKDDLFVAALDLPARPQQIVPVLLQPGPDGVGERLVRFFFTIWDTPAGRERIVALLGAVATSDQAARMMREFLTRELFSRIADGLGGSRPQLRGGLVASQLVGVAVTRYVVRIEPMVSASIDELVAWLAPTVQRYLTAPEPSRLSES